jgi:uncharacterized protein YPO0396
LYFNCFRLIDLLAKRPSIDDISAKLKVLETEHESLQTSLKEFYENETKMKKELEDKHAKEMSEMAEKLKDSNRRVKILASKLKAAEAEASEIYQIIFRKDFMIPACIRYIFLPYRETNHKNYYMHQRCSDLTGKWILAFPALMHMKKL